MPTLYLDRPFMDVVSDHAERMGRGNTGYVRPREAVYDMLQPEYQRRIDKRRGDTA